jgi:hypothetical protein
VRRRSPPLLANRLRPTDEMRIRQPASMGSRTGSEPAFASRNRGEIQLESPGREAGGLHPISRVATRGTQRRLQLPLSCITILRLQPRGFCIHRNVYLCPMRIDCRKCRKRRRCTSPSREHGQVDLRSDTIPLPPGCLVLHALTGLEDASSRFAPRPRACLARVPHNNPSRKRLSRASAEGRHDRGVSG